MRKKGTFSQWALLHIERWFHFFLELVLGIYLKSRFRLVTEHFERQYDLKPPYVVLANHSSNWDPFFVNLCIHNPMRFVASNTHFRSILGAIGLNLVGAIPKAKGMADTRSIRRIIQVCRKGAVLGIFAEGESCWSGDSVPPIPSTAKLLKVLRLPVLTVNVFGAFFAAGRWCRYPKRGTVRMHMHPPIPASEVQKLSVDELYQRISDRLQVRQSEEQQQHRSVFKGKAPAQYLERSLFICPSCNQIGTLYSTPSTLLCKKCQYQVRYTEYGDFVPVKGNLRFSTIAQWFGWQMALFRNIIERIDDVEKVILHEPFMEIFLALGEAPLQKKGTVSVSLFADRLELAWKTETKSMLLNELQGFNVQKNEQVEFYYHSCLYKLRPASPRACMVSWKTAVLFLQSRQ